MVVAKDIMSKRVVTISPNETIAKTIAKMEKTGAKELPIVDEKKRLLGMVTYYDILDFFKADPEEKISKLKFMPPTANENSTMEEIVSLMIKSGIEAIPIVEDEKVVGIVSDYDILKQMLNEKKLKKMKVHEVMREEILRISPEEPIATARRIMRYNNVDRLPVIDEDNSLLGLVVSIDLIKFILRQPRQKQGSQDRAGKTTSPFEMPVKSIMKKNVPFVKPEEKAIAALNKLLENNLKGTAVIDKKNRVIGLFFVKDILHHMFEGGMQEGVWVNFTGYPIKKGTLDILNSYLAADIRKIKTIAPDAESINIHIEQLHAASGKKWNYEISVALITKSKKKIVLENQKIRYGYNLLYTLQDALKKLKKILEKRYKKRSGKNYYAQ